MRKAQKKCGSKVCTSAADATANCSHTSSTQQSLQKWEERSTLHSAKCGNCDADMNSNAKYRKCNLCGVKKPLHAFSPAKQQNESLFQMAMQRFGFPSMFLLWHCSDAARTESIYVFCDSIPALFLRSPQTSAQQISHRRKAELAVRSVQTVNSQQTFTCNRQRQSKSPDFQAPDIVIKYAHAGVA